jgi:heat shock protein HspQ
VDTVIAQFFVGQIVHHKLFDYRGVVIDVDPEFRGSETWYEKVALSRPPKDKPWYHVLQDGTDRRTYVAERNLEPDESGVPVSHPEIEDHFIGMTDDVYIPRRTGN